MTAVKVTRRDKVLSALRRGLGQGDGWVCGRTLAHHKVGGWRYGARLHELRERGHAIQTAPCRCDRCRYARDNTPAGQQPSDICKYRLITEGP